MSVPVCATKSSGCQSTAKGIMVERKSRTKQTTGKVAGQNVYWPMLFNKWELYDVKTMDRLKYTFGNQLGTIKVKT
jgi:hypothetical protein